VVPRPSLNRRAGRNTAAVVAHGRDWVTKPAFPEEAGFVDPLRQQPLGRDRRPYIRGHPPSRIRSCGTSGSPAADAIDWDTLVERFNASRDACLAALAALSDESLAEKMPGPFGDPSTRAGLLGNLAIHQCYHAGQLGMARRAAGKTAAILAPGQAAPL
jgi:hypothetical protein